MNNAKLPKKIVKLIFISLFVSLLLSIYITYKYDKFESDNVVHSMVKGDAHPIWKRAAKLKKIYYLEKIIFHQGVSCIDLIYQ